MDRHHQSSPREASGRRHNRLLVLLVHNKSRRRCRGRQCSPHVDVVLAAGGAVGENHHRRQHYFQ